MTFFKQLEVGDMQNFAYLVGDDDVCAVVDPGFDAGKISEAAEGRRIVKIILTHSHYDHAGAVGALCKDQDIDVITHELEPYSGQHTKVKDDEIITVGSISIKVIHTPGHSPGSMCLLIDDNLITGDTLFIDGCGRTDLGGGDTKKLFDSISDRILTLPDDTVVWPGHDYGNERHATLKEQKQSNPYLRCDSFDEFQALRG